MTIEVLQPITLDGETLKILEAEIQTKLLKIVNEANFPAILRKFGQEPDVAGFNFRLNKSQTPCSHTAKDKSRQLTSLQEEIQTKYLEILNSANFPAILEKFGQKPENLQFQFRLKQPISAGNPRQPVSVWNCLGCYCSCWDEDIQRFVGCPCPP